MEKNGLVVGLRGSKAIIEIARMSSCGDKCATCAGGCSTPPLVVEVDNALQAKQGDFVVLEAPEHAIIQSTMIMYTLPLVVFILGVVLGMQVFAGFVPANPELVGILTGFIFLVFSYVGIALFRKDKQILKMRTILKKL